MFLVWGISLLALPACVRAQDANDAPLGDVARSFRRKTVTSDAVIDNDNLTKVVDNAESRRASGASPVFSLDTGGKSFHVSSPDVSCSLSFTAKNGSSLSEPLLDDLPRTELAKLGHDVDKNTVAKYMPRYIPGKPTMIVRNMPGGGHVLATNFMFNQAAKDGTYLALVNNGMPLHQVLDGRVGRRFERLVERKNGLSRDVSAAGTNLDAPCRQVTAIIRELDGTRHSPLPTEVVKYLFELARRWIHIGCRLGKFQLDRLSRAIEWNCFDLEFGKRARAIDRPSRAPMRQIRIV